MTAEDQDLGHGPANAVTGEGVNALGQNPGQRVGRVHTSGNAMNCMKEINGGKNGI